MGLQACSLPSRIRAQAWTLLRLALMRTLLLAAAPAALFASCTQAATQVLQTRSGPIQIESLAQLDNPWGMAYLPDGRLLITEKPGRLRVFAEGKLSQPIPGVPEVAYRGQGGLLD